MKALVEFRTTAAPQRSVQIYYRRDRNNQVVSVSYGKRENGETFTEAEREYLLNLNNGHDITTEDQGWVYEVATPQQYKIEREEIFCDPVEIGKHLIATVPQLGERGQEITITYGRVGR